MTCHSFNTSEAEKHGVDAAIIIYNIRFWLNHNKANRTHINDGYVWTYNSARAFAELFPYWSSNKIQKTLRKLESEGVIITGNYNKAKYDKTKWYSLPEFFVGSKSDPSAKRLNGPSQKAQPIPDINTDVINKRTDINKIDEYVFLIRAISREFPLCAEAIRHLGWINGNGNYNAFTGALTLQEWEYCESAMRSVDDFDMEYFTWWMKEKSPSMRKTPSLPNMLTDMNGTTFEQFYNSTFMQEYED
ncbi:coil containing protein [Vibrio phage 1.198.B._10N.286.54.F4]|nr:coil containing protein [Vibrio phage 1.198.A._10N.286.54.F4]AUR94805.1 coil containing protein [Vibrio phage 1.198.B._10N.286.54.F4]